MADPASDKRKRRTQLAIALLVLAILAFSLWRMYFSRSGGLDFAFRRGAMEALVAAAKKIEVKPGGMVGLASDEPFDAKTLHVATRFDPLGEGRVWARREASGAWVVTIVTRDLGQLGLYGYIFSEVPLTIDRERRAPEVPGRLLVGEKIDAKWWSAYNAEF